MNLIRALKIELLKWQNNPMLWIFFFISLVLFFTSTYLFIQDFIDSYNRTTSVTNDPDPWRFFIEACASRIEICLGLNILLMVGWFHFMEYSNNMWTKNLLFPLPVLHIIIAKTILVLIFLILIQLFLFSFTLFFVKPLIVNRYNFLFTKDYPEPQSVYYLWFLCYLLAIPKVIIFHFWFSLKLHRAFLLAFFVGFIGLMLRFFWYSPYSLYFRIGKPDLNDIILSILYSSIFLYFIRKEVKSYFE